MKIFALILLLINISVVFVLYGDHQNQTAQAKKASAPEDVPLLKLIDGSLVKIDTPATETSFDTTDPNSRKLTALTNTDAPRDCLLLGPFAEGFRADAVVNMLTDLKIDAKKRNRKTDNQKVPYSYRVYLPSLPSLEEAQALAATLDAANIKDYYVITKSDDKINGISLGVYTRKQGLIERQAQLDALGLKVEFEVRERDQPSAAWVQFPADTTLNSGQIQTLKRQGVEPQLLPAPCE